MGGGRCPHALRSSGAVQAGMGVSRVGGCLLLTPSLFALFQRLRSQRGGHRQQDRTSNGELQCPSSAPPPGTFALGDPHSPGGCRGFCPKAFPALRVDALSRGGSLLPRCLLGRAAPLSAVAAAQLIGSGNAAVRREPGGPGQDPPDWGGDRARSHW